MPIELQAVRVTEASNVVAFPLQLRAVPASPAPEAAIATGPQPAVDHDGRLYPLHDLLRALTPEELRTVEASVPRSGQDAWDAVVRNWPALAAEIVASVPEVR